MIFKCYPKIAVKEGLKDVVDKYIRISISTMPDEHVRIEPGVDGEMDSIYITFNDLDKKIDHEIDEFLFSVENANQILDFVEYHSKLLTSPTICVINCEAGVSRSPAVTAALTKIFEGGHDTYWFLRYRPNMLVYRTLLNVAIERGLYEPKSRK